MKILHILYSGLGGHGNVFFSLVRADLHHEFTHAALFNGVEPVREEYISQCEERGIPWSYVKKKPGLHPAFYIRLYRQIKKTNPDIIFLHGGIAVLPARLNKLFSSRKKKILVRETQANHLKNRGDWIRLALSMIFADKVVYLSVEYQDEIRKKMNWIYRNNKSTVIPNGIDLDFYKPASGPRSDKIVLGMQGRLVNTKDHATLLQAVALLRKNHPELNMKLIIAGEGDCKNSLVQQAGELQISDTVVFTGQLDEKNLVHYLQELDIYIHASYGETMSTAIMQAMACGKPIVASDVPGISNMITNHENGLLVSPGQPEELEKILFMIIGDKALQERLGKAALKYAQERFSNQVMFNRYKSIFNA